jgi:DNA-binding MarR family transcriptional regulator
MPKKKEQLRFQGVSTPNTTQVPDQYLDELLAELTGAELKVLLYITRRTFGFKKQSDNISLSQLLKGITTKDHRVLDKGTGLTKPTLLKALRSLQEKNIIRTERRRSEGRGDESTAYSLVFADNEGGKKSSPPW